MTGRQSKWIRCEKRRREIGWGIETGLKIQTA